MKSLATACLLCLTAPQILHVHPSSVLFNRAPPSGYVIFHEVVETSKRFMRDLTVIEEVSWILSALRDLC